MTYQERIRALREDRDLKQWQIARMLGVAQTTYSQYELGKRPLPVEYLIALCRFYGVSADYILGLEKPQCPRGRDPGERR
jgi:transcriptional regulator with XRE-family HTH domain